MNAIQSLVAELIAAIRAHRGPDSGLEQQFRTVLPGIEDGSFSQLDPDDQINRLYWLNAAYFGRGELDRVLVENGHLPRNFHNDFYHSLLEYQLSVGVEEGKRKLLDNNLAALVQRRQK